MKDLRKKIALILVFTFAFTFFASAEKKIIISSNIREISDKITLSDICSLYTSQSLPKIISKLYGERYVKIQSLPADLTPSVSTPSPTPHPTVAPTKSPVSENLSYVQQVIDLVNIERKNNGLSALKENTALSAAAQARAKETVKYFSHTRPNGESCFTILKEYGISYHACGENIAMGQKSPEQVVSAWMNSEGHRKNILNPNFTAIGVGCHSENGTYYWSQLFIG